MKIPFLDPLIKLCLLRLKWGLEPSQTFGEEMVEGNVTPNQHVSGNLEKKHRNGEFSNVKIFVVPLVLVFCKNCRYAALMVDTDDQSWLRALQLLEDSERRGVAANDVMFGKACMRPLAAYGETQEDVRTMGWCVHGFTLHLQLEKRELKIVDAKMVLCRPSTVVQLLLSVKLTRCQRRTRRVGLLQGILDA